MRHDNRIILDLSKVQWARFGYRNQHGDFRDKKPTEPTVFNQSFTQHEMCWQQGQTMLAYATAKKILDVWQPEVKFKLTAHECLVYTGEKAISLYAAWREKIFNKK